MKSNGRTSKKGSVWAVAVCILFGASIQPARAFPPYRTTDADTADPKTLELRVGFAKLEHDDGDTEYVTPMFRGNIGLPGKAELISEFEYVPQNGAFGDAAAGFKWVPWFRPEMSFGVESLALLPVRAGDAGAGIETQLLATFRSDAMRLHLNAGGFYDPRTSRAETGWRASILGEFPRGRFRPGVELFAKQAKGDGVDLRAGAGVILAAGSLDIRSGVHAGLTDTAPDIVFSLWIATAVPF